MHISEVVHDMLPRLQRLKLVDPVTGFYDLEEVEWYCLSAVQYLVQRYQLQHFTRINRELFRTVNTVESYQLPVNLGFKPPENERQSGFAIASSDGSSPSDLQYYEPARFTLLYSTTTGKPARFTFAQNLMYLQPIPDGVYIIQALDRAASTDVPDHYVSAVQIETLWRMASDQEKATALMADERMHVLRTLVNGEARQRQRFNRSHDSIGQMR